MGYFRFHTFGHNINLAFHRNGMKHSHADNKIYTVAIYFNLLYIMLKLLPLFKRDCLL